MSERDPLEYAINRMEAARDVPPPTVDYPVRRKELLDGIAALRASEAALSARVKVLEEALREIVDATTFEPEQLQAIARRAIEEGKK